MANDNRSGNWWLVPVALFGARILVYGGRHSDHSLGPIVGATVVAGVLGLAVYFGYSAVSSRVATSRASRTAELLDAGRVADAEIALTEQLRSATSERRPQVLAELAWVRLRAGRFPQAREALEGIRLLGLPGQLICRVRAIQALLAATRGEGPSGSGILALAEGTAQAPFPDELSLARLIVPVAAGDHARAGDRATELLDAAMKRGDSTSRHVVTVALLVRAYLDAAAGKPAPSTIAPRHPGEFAWLANVPGLGAFLAQVGAAKAA